jgi:heme a synthase
MTSDAYHPWLHRFAVLTACVALLPIVVGALVTTMNAGMAFPDWPTSNQQNMFLYPWLKSAGDEFIEHGHRLAGVLIGLMSIGLTVLVWWLEPRRWVQVAGTLVLVGVIAQGVLGGQRVLLDDRGLAMLHGSFAACVFALMAAVAAFTGRSWFEAAERYRDADVRYLKPIAVLVPFLISVQYVLGGLVRHQHRGLHSHLGFAFVVLAFVIALAVLAHRSRISWLRRAGWLLLALVVVQALLGGGTWVMRFGFPPMGYVAMHGSAWQIGFRTVHTVAGMLVLMTSVIFALRVFRIDSLSAAAGRSGRVSRSVSVSGGVG